MVVSSMTLTIPAERLGDVALSERDAVVDIATHPRERVPIG